MLSLGTIFDNVQLSKNVSFDGKLAQSSVPFELDLKLFVAFDGLSPGVTVSNVFPPPFGERVPRLMCALIQPDFPGDASNGIKLTLNSEIPSPSNLGIVLGDVTFIASFEGSESASFLRPQGPRAVSAAAELIFSSPNSRPGSCRRPHASPKINDIVALDGNDHLS